MKKIIFTLVILAISMRAFANASCTQKLENIKWPLDCFVFLKIKKVPRNHVKYAQINEWCRIYKFELLKKPPPKAVFSLYMPPNCFAVAIKAREHQASLRILKGTFLKNFP